MKSSAWISTSVFALGMALAAPSRANEPAAAAAPADDGAATAEPAAAEKGTGHGFQFGLRAAVGTGYRVVFRYEDSAYCADDPEQKFCGFGSAPLLDLAASFAPLDGIEPFVWLRLGLDDEAPTNTDPLKVFGVGLRVYTMSDAPFKIFIEPALGVEVEGGGDQPRFSSFSYKTDFMVRLAVGAQYDFSRYAGVYANVGLGVGVTRAIHSTLDVFGGLQLRAP